MKSGKYWYKLQKQRKFSSQKGIKLYLKTLYSQFSDNINSSKAVLEVGAGAGTSLEFLSADGILRTDYLESDIPEVKGGIDLHSLPYNDEQFDFIFGMDVLHHLSRPFTALEELRRVSRKSRKRDLMMFIEPYVSVLSFLPYRLFHQESTSLNSKLLLREPLVSEDPEDGDQTIPRLLFTSKIGKKKIQGIFPETEYLIETKFVSVLSFFLTGGINRPLPIPPSTIALFIKIESKFPQSIMRLIASRMIITIKKI